jgi:hypothetical protein
MTSSLTAYTALTRTLDRVERAIANRADVANATRSYLARIEKVRTVEDLMKDAPTLTYVLRAFGLEDMSYAKAMIRKVLTEGVDRRDALANRLSDARFRELAEVFNFPRHGTATTIFERTREGIVSRYVRQQVEQTASQSNEAVALALYFERKAPTLRSAYGILADRKLLTVVQTLVDLSPATGGLPIDRQAELIGQRLNLSDLTSPEKVRSMMHKFLAKWDVLAPSKVFTPLLSAQPTISTDVLISLQALTSRSR